MTSEAIRLHGEMNNNHSADFPPHTHTLLSGFGLGNTEQRKVTNKYCAKLKLKYSCWYSANRYVCSANAMRFAKFTRLAVEDFSSTKGAYVGREGT